jgi:hypothetical protein
MITVFGVAAVTFMVTMYALDARHRHFTLAFGCGCLLASAYGFLSGAWPFGVVEIAWAVIAVRRWRTRVAGRGNEPNRGSGSTDRPGN